jgi:NtrC-family two-component system sensor histidine kinase KinB
VRASCDEAGIALQLRLEDAPRTVWGDAARLQVVLANLLLNAVKYTPRGGSITIAARARPQDGDPHARLELAVTDTGPGIPEEYRRRVFEKFFRVEHHRAGADEGVRGSGIGLYLAEQIVVAHRGTIRCEAGDDGRGTRIVLELPAQRLGEALTG